MTQKRGYAIFRGMANELLTPEQAGAAAGVTAETVRRWAKKGLVPHVVLPSGQIRFRPDHLDAFLRERTADPESAA